MSALLRGATEHQGVCRYCGAQVNPGIRTCSYCGARWRKGLRGLGAIVGIPALLIVPIAVLSGLFLLYIDHHNPLLLGALIGAPVLAIYVLWQLFARYGWSKPHAASEPDLDERW